MRRTIYLIVEDETDAEVVRAILAQKNPDLRISPLIPPGKSGGVSRLEKALERLLKTALKERQEGDCIAVLHDADIHKQPDRHAYEQIKTICKKHSQDVKLIVAYDEIEAWLLADEGFCKWLGIKAQNADSMKHPSAKLNHIVKEKKGKKFPLIRSQALRYVDGSGDKLSKSMANAVDALRKANCIKS